jgi:2-hydroxychromene-2-carboxylate isomerase
MIEPVDISVFFNFRSPYCYLASKNMFRLFDNFHARMIWRPLAGWDGRSQPERQKYKLPIVRQDVARFAQRMGIPCNPPPMTTDSTRAAAGSLLAEAKGVLRPYIVEVMRAEWGDGKDIGDLEVLLPVAERVGLDRDEFETWVDSGDPAKQLAVNWEAAEKAGVFGVPSFTIDSEIFWGNDRIEFVEDLLRDRRLARL